jgi:ferrochelatase
MKKQYKKALILLNMGGISSKDEIKVFLHNMFNDKNIITTKSDTLRAFIAKIIIFFRLKTAMENYGKIQNNSPLLKITNKLIKKLSKQLKNTYITCSMAYTPPFSSDIIGQLKQLNLKEVFLFPMYPQYSSTTTKSSLEDMSLQIQNHLPNVKITYINRFYTNKNLIKMTVDEIISKVKNKEKIKDYNIIFSAHSLPISIIKNGDSYEREINHHIKLIKQEFAKRDIKPHSFILAYQSKLGPVQWLYPSLEHIIKNMPPIKKKLKEIKKAIVYPISFSIDNAETIYELSIEMKDLAIKDNNFDKFKVCRCFNDKNEFVNIIKDIIK